MLKKIFVLLFVLILGLSNAFAQGKAERKLMPADEAAKDASFSAFRAQLLRAVKNRDSNFILSIVDRNIKNGFGGNDGIREFQKQWKLDSPGSEFWNEFSFVITHGGYFENRRKTFVAPYVFKGFPEDLDAFEYAAIMGANVSLYPSPSSIIIPIGKLSYNIVKIDSEKSVRRGEEPLWYSVETTGGRQGFVEAKFVRSPVAYRAFFEKQKGKWKLTNFLAGD